jgi:hypothetical protein
MVQRGFSLPDVPDSEQGELQTGFLSASRVRIEGDVHEELLVRLILS